MRHEQARLLLKRRLRILERQRLILRARRFEYDFQIGQSEVAIVRPARTTFLQRRIREPFHAQAQEERVSSGRGDRAPR